MVDMVENEQHLQKWPEVPVGFTRYFSGGIENVLEICIDSQGKFDKSRLTPNDNRTWIWITTSPDDELRATAKSAIIEAKKRGGKPVIISGVVDKKTVETVGFDEASSTNCVHGPVHVDRIFIVTGTYKRHRIIDVTKKYLK